MKKLIILIGFACGLSGCNTLVNQLPTVQNCYELHYNRIGVDVDLSMKCRIDAAGTELVNIPKPF